MNRSCLSLCLSVWSCLFFEMMKISSSSAPRDMKFCTQLPYDPHGHIPSLGGSPTNPRMVTHQHKDGHPPNQTWSPTWRMCTTDMEFGTYTLLWKLPPGDNGHGWSPTIPRRVTRKTQGWSPKEKKEVFYRHGIWHLHITRKTNTKITAMDGHLLSLWWSPTILMMVTYHQMPNSKNVVHFLLEGNHPKVSEWPFFGWWVTILGMVAVIP